MAVDYGKVRIGHTTVPLCGVFEHASRLTIAAILSLLVGHAVHSQETVASKRVASEPMSLTETTQLLDDAFARIWEDSDLQPAPLATESEFLRRVFLDLAGRIPSVAEARRYLESTPVGDVTKKAEIFTGRLLRRQKLVRELLDRGLCSTHLANQWRLLLLDSAATDLQTQALAPALQNWLQLRMSNQTPYDEWVAELLTTPLANADPAQLPGQPSTGATPIAFYQANERSPEKLAAATSRLFLGVQVQCAECHDHPYADWTQESFWSYAAFFDDLNANRETAVTGQVDLLKIEIPNTERSAAARFLDTSTPDNIDGKTRRQLVSQWITGPSNPFFARAAVNRVWDTLFGRGLIDPVDALDTVTTPFDQVLGVLADQFVQHEFDLSFLIESITATRMYQLTSRTEAGPSTNVETSLIHFARMPARRLSAAQLYDSLAQATGYQPSSIENQPLAAQLQNDPRSEFVRLFSTTESPLDAQTSILQALALMNGDLVSTLR